MADIQSLCVFCGASRNVSSSHLHAAGAFGAMLARKKVALVYGGGGSGLMGALADGALKEGGHVTGIFPRSLTNMEAEHKALTEMVVVESMHERKRLMFERSDAVAVLPGGVGTLDELFEVLTWKQLRFHRKPIVIFNHEGYWDTLLALMDSIIAHGFAAAQMRAQYRVADSLETLWEAIAAQKL